MTSKEIKKRVAGLLVRLGLDADLLKDNEALTPKLKTLRLEIIRHRQLYYNKAASEISDEEFDFLEKYLVSLEQRRESKKPIYRRQPELPLNDSPTAQVGADHAPGFQEVEHRQLMLSLDNVYNEAEIRSFDTRLHKILNLDDLRYTIEPKIDGFAVSLTYEHGKFVRAVTRGTRDKGDDITKNVLTIKSLPRELAREPNTKIPAIVEIRGEIFLTAAEFERINAERSAAGEELYANPRNTAAGTIKQLDVAEVSRRKLSIVLYGLGYCEPPVVKSQSELHQKLRSWGLPTVEKIWHASGVDEVWSAIEELDQLRKNFAYGTDGAVVKLDDMSLQAQVGATAKAPGWAIAYKFKADTARTRLRAITIQVGKTGILSPVAELVPISLAGSTIARATLHNEDEIRRKDIRVGDLVEIEKAGEVIPAVLRSFPEERPVGTSEFDLPAAVGYKCPVCGGGIAKVEVADEEAQGVAWKCQNYDCRAQRVGRLELFCSRRALAIDSIGEIVASKLVERELVKSPLDIFSLSEQALAELNLGTEEKKRVLGEPLARKIIQAREAARNLPLAKWLFALSIPDVGEETARDIAKKHADMKAVARSEALNDISELAQLNDEIIRNSPQAKENKSKTVAEKEAMRPLWKDCMQRADALGEKLIAKGYACRAWKQYREAIILSENTETARFRELLARIDKTAAKERMGKDSAELNRMKSEHESAKKQADKLGKELIAAGYAERSSHPARNAITVVGPIAARSTIKWFKSEVGQRFLERLHELGIEPKGEKSVQTVSLFSGKTVVISGSIPGMTRPEAQDRVRALGGNIASSVSSKTDILVAGPGAGSKLEEARKNGTRIVDETEFLKLLEAESSPSPELKLE